MTRKIIITGIYITVFWGLIPYILFMAAGLIDREMAWETTFSTLWSWVGGGLFILSLVLLFLAIGQFRLVGKELPVSATPPRLLVQWGLFAVWRHPIYLFYTTGFTGLALVVGSRGLLMVVMPVFAILVILYAIIEEVYLVKRFGGQYRAYRNSTALVIPRLIHLLKLPARILFGYFFRLRIHHRGRIPRNPPFFIIASHRNYLDPFFISLAVRYPVTWVTTFEVFRRPITRYFFNKFFTIPRKRYLKDVSSTRKLFRAVRDGRIIGLFPEGERSWTGSVATFKKETLQLLRKMNTVPILPVRIDGNYRAWPRWGDNIRRSDVRVVIQDLICLKASDSLTDIETRIRAAITPEEAGLDCHGRKLAQGIPRVIYRCPSCLEMESLVISGDREFTCRECKTGYAISNDYSIQYSLAGQVLCESIAELYDRVKIRKEDITFKAQGLNSPQTENGCPGPAAGRLWVEENERFRLLNTGTFILGKDILRITGSTGEDSINLVDIGSLTVESNCKLQVYNRQKARLYQLTFEDRSVLLWQDAMLATLERYHGLKPNFR